MLSKQYSVLFKTPVLCNSAPISQKGVVAVLCPVAVLGKFPLLVVGTEQVHNIKNSVQRPRKGAAKWKCLEGGRTLNEVW